MEEYWLEGYMTSRDLAMEVCFAMSQAYGVKDVSVTYFDGYGWHVECLCTSKASEQQIRAMLKDKFDKVNWLR